MRPDPHSPSDERVREATGRGWQAWFELLDERGAAKQDHKAIVAILADVGGATHWWQQTITVAYEKARGLRSVVGETADAGFQVGVRRTLEIDADTAWLRLVEGPWRVRWVGATDAFEPTKGATYRCDDGTSGEVRSVRSGRRLRLTWHPPDWDAPSTLQLTVIPKDERCVVALHHERLPDEATRSAMKTRWTEMLDGLRAELAGDDGGSVG